jgi:organic radical activating enzyme
MKVARKKARCKVLCPGTRSVIWFHGCPRQCPGCIADTMNETAEYETVSPQQLADWRRASHIKPANKDGVRVQQQLR